MSPNGRRAWRKWVRRQDLRRKHKQPKGSVCRMARQARRHLPLVPGVVPSEPFTARALVGMTMGSRKRAYRAAVAELEQAEVWRGDVVDRSRLHIGERLRPCLGCEECRGYDDGIGVIHCDGSGVLQARRP